MKLEDTESMTRLLDKFDMNTEEGKTIRNLIYLKNYYKALSEFIERKPYPESQQVKSDISNNQINLFV